MRIRITLEYDTEDMVSPQEELDALLRGDFNAHDLSDLRDELKLEARAERVD